MGESQQAGRQAETDQTGPDQSRQAGLSHSFLPFLPTTRCRGGGRSIGLARREREDGNFETASRRVSTRRERETLTPLTSRKARGKGRTRGDDDDDDVTMCSPSKRREMDVMKLLMSDFNVQVENDNIQEFFVNFEGPKDSPYEGGVWKVHVELPEAYPHRSPSIGFVNRIFHPNVDEMAGSVCLDVINQTWSPMFDLINVFEVFLPQLLLYPNPTDPLNGEAAALLMREPERYKIKVREYVQKHAFAEAAQTAEAAAEGDESELSELSAMSEDDELAADFSDDDEPAGSMEL